MRQGHLVREGLALLRKIDGSEALLGHPTAQSEAILAEALDAAPTGASFVYAYLEIPLLGDAGYDLQFYYYNQPNMSWPEEEYPFGLDRFIRWNALQAGKRQSFDLAYDMRDALASGRALTPPTQYCTFGGTAEQHCLAAKECATTAPGYEDFREVLPRFVDRVSEMGFVPYYLGTMPQRASRLARIGLYVLPPLERRLANDPDGPARLLEDLGCVSKGGAMVECLRQTTQAYVANDLQLDITPDGGVSSLLGICLRLRYLNLWERRNAATQNRISRLMGLIRGWGLADDRADLLSQITQTGQMSMPDGAATSPLAIQSAIEYIKVRCNDESIIDAKAYVTLRAYPYAPAASTPE